MKFQILLLPHAEAPPTYKPIKKCFELYKPMGLYTGFYGMKKRELKCLVNEETILEEANQFSSDQNFNHLLTKKKLIHEKLTVFSLAAGYELVMFNDNNHSTYHLLILEKADPLLKIFETIESPLTSKNCQIHFSERPTAF